MIFLFVSALSLNAGENDDDRTAVSGLYVSVSGGIQMSGYKRVDFVSSNYSPMIGISTGKWFTPLLALQISYRGNYFHTISDLEKHYYKFFYGDAVFNLVYLIKPTSSVTKGNVCFHIGSGYFHNRSYGHGNICANIGLSGNMRIVHNFSAGISVSSIIGWDIYQGDEDILPATSISISYAF